MTTIARHFSGAVGTKALSEVAFPLEMSAVADEAEAGEQEVELEKRAAWHRETWSRRRLAWV